MKKVCLFILGLLMTTSVMAKDYTVTIPDKYVVYFERAFARDNNITPSIWLTKQAMRLIDRIVDREYMEARVEGKTRDEKIADTKEVNDERR